MRDEPRQQLAVLHRVLIGSAVFLVLLLIGVQVARAVEIIPSVVITRATNGGDDDARISGGLALRTDLAPFVMGEIGASYRNEERFGGDLHVKQWPITGSLWLKPLPVLYAGGGAGWYHTTLDYADALAIPDATDSMFGVHLGGGVRLPLMPVVSLDLQARYVFLESIEQKISIRKLDPDFWSTWVGLAIAF